MEEEKEIDEGKSEVEKQNEKSTNKKKVLAREEQNEKYRKDRDKKFRERGERGEGITR